LLEGLSPSFAVVFISAHFPGSAEALVAAVAEETGPLPLIGCAAQAVVRGTRGIKSGPPFRSGSLLG
jgi:small ligand-binding sensory domain FIST